MISMNISTESRTGVFSLRFYAFEINIFLFSVLKNCCESGYGMLPRLNDFHRMPPIKLENYSKKNRRTGQNK